MNNRHQFQRFLEFAKQSDRLVSIDSIPNQQGIRADFIADGSVAIEVKEVLSGPDAALKSFFREDPVLSQSPTPISVGRLIEIRGEGYKRAFLKRLTRPLEQPISHGIKQITKSCADHGLKCGALIIFNKKSHYYNTANMNLAAYEVIESRQKRGRDVSKLGTIIALSDQHLPNGGVEDDRLIASMAIPYCPDSDWCQALMESIFSDFASFNGNDITYNEREGVDEIVAPFNDNVSASWTSLYSSNRYLISLTNFSLVESFILDCTRMKAICEQDSEPSLEQIRHLHDLQTEFSLRTLGINDLEAAARRLKASGYSGPFVYGFAKAQRVTESG